MSPGRTGGDDPEPGSFGDAISGVKPLADRDRRTTRPTGARAPERPAPARFHRPDPAEAGLGGASGVQTSQLRRLRAGRIRPERSIDLHGLRAQPARRRLHAELASAFEEGARCVLVVHGRGLHSKQAAVLRDALPGWLADPALEGRVLAFAPARPADGGAGASYVLLRRARG